MSSTLKPKERFKGIDGPRFRTCRSAAEILHTKSSNNPTAISATSPAWSPAVEATWILWRLHSTKSMWSVPALGVTMMPSDGRSRMASAETFCEGLHNMAWMDEGSTFCSVRNWWRGTFEEKALRKRYLWEFWASKIGKIIGGPNTKSGWSSLLSLRLCLSSIAIDGWAPGNWYCQTVQIFILTFNLILKSKTLQTNKDRTKRGMVLLHSIFSAHSSTITTKQKNRSALYFDHQGQFGYTHNAPFLHNVFHFLFSNLNTACRHVILIHIPLRGWQKVE